LRYSIVPKNTDKILNTICADILGLQQIRRPNFDRHGAWLTMGNVELHLIKGVPTVYEGEMPTDD
jgi:hypothetical protein